MIAVPLALAAVRFASFLGGDVLAFRDTAYFFAPWRDVFARAARAGAFPFWNEWMSCGRAFAANPNAAVFWPLTPAVLFVGFTGLGLLNIAVLLLGTLLALRLAGASRAAAAAATVVFLFSGVFQTLPTLFSPIAAAAPIPLLLAASLENGGRRRIALIAGALALSVFGGEPAVTAIGAAGAFFLAAFSETASRTRRVGQLVAAGLLAAGVAAVQILPAASELSRSARADLRPESGALFWSVRPARVLTLFEPRLTGDPYAENDLDFWGAGTFDAGNPYYHDLAIGVVPLLVALAAGASRRGRVFLGLAALGAVLAMGKYLPGYALFASLLSFLRYAEKWWLLATLALVFAVAEGLDLLLGRRADEESRRAVTLLRRASLASGGFLLAGALAVTLAPRLVRAFLWSVHLGIGPTPPERISALLSPLLFGGAALAALMAIVPSLVEKGRLSRRAAYALVSAVFLLDASRRVVGTCPAAPADTYRRTTPALELVRRSLGDGRFYDDGADDAATAVRRATEASGFDPLRPTTGVLHGIRYAGENDIDRMTPREEFAWAAALSRLPWGEAKAKTLRKAGVTVVRTPAPPPDPEGTKEIGRFGSDRIVALLDARAEFDLVTGGRVKVVSRSPNRVQLDVSVDEPRGRLRIARTFDPGWHAVVDGAPVRLDRSDGFLSALDVANGRHRVELFYENSTFLWGGILSAASLVVLAGLVILPMRSKAR